MKSIRSHINGARFRCTILAGLLFFSPGAPTMAQSAMVRSVKGSPKYMVSGMPVPLFSGDRVPPGTVITTGENDSVVLAVGAKDRLVSLGANSQLRFERNEKYLILDRGEIVGSVRASRKGTAERDSVTIKSPLGTTRVNAADFSVSTADSSVKVLSGKDVVHEPVLRADSARAGRSAMQISAGSGIFQQNGQASLGQLQPKANSTLMRQIDRLVTAENTGAPTVKAAASVTFTTPQPSSASPGTGTPGYWKNHAEAWPASGVTIGGRTYTVTQAINNMQTSKTDRTYSMFQDLVSAKLNTQAGNDSTCIASFIQQADAWMAAHPVGSSVSGSSTAWQQGEPIHQQLDAYNNGQLCAPHRN